MASPRSSMSAMEGPAVYVTSSWFNQKRSSCYLCTDAMYFHVKKSKDALSKLKSVVKASVVDARPLNDEGRIPLGFKLITKSDNFTFEISSQQELEAWLNFWSDVLGRPRTSSLNTRADRSAGDAGSPHLSQHDQQSGQNPAPSSPAPTTTDDHQSVYPAHFEGQPHGPSMPLPHHAGHPPANAASATLSSAGSLQQQQQQQQHQQQHQQQYPSQQHTHQYAPQPQWRHYPQNQACDQNHASIDSATSLPPAYQEFPPSSSVGAASLPADASMATDLSNPSASSSASVGSSSLPNAPPPGRTDSLPTYEATIAHDQAKLPPF